MAVDFDKVLNEGLISLIAEAEAELEKLRHSGDDSLARLRYLQAAILIHRAVVDFSGRYADLAAAMAQTESRQAEIPFGINVEFSRSTCLIPD